MKCLFFISLAVVSVFATCQKDPVEGMDGQRTLKVNACSSFSQDGINYSICLDSVANESRCAIGGECVWAGFAKAKFIFTEGGNVHHFYLYTPVNTNSFPADTVINGMKIAFKALTPYPAINIRYDYDEYKATVELKKQ